MTTTGPLLTEPLLTTAIGIGGITVRLHTADPAFLSIVEERYAGFLPASTEADYDFQVEIVEPPELAPDEEARVWCEGGLWRLTRGDFRAEWDPRRRRGHIRQSANPYSIDSVLRIVHTLLLAREGGFLLHSSSAVRNGRAFLFAGVSGAGKTGISRLAPADATLLTDEMSYVRREGDAYFAYGTPFAGELAKPGENIRAPIAGLFLLSKGPENRIEDVTPGEALRGILANVLFFAREQDLVRQVFDSACQFAARVPVRRLTFFPDERVWELIV